MEASCSGEFDMLPARENSRMHTYHQFKAFPTDGAVVLGRFAMSKSARQRRQRTVQRLMAKQHDENRAAAANECLCVIGLRALNVTGSYQDALKNAASVEELCLNFPQKVIERFSS